MEPFTFQISPATLERVDAGVEWLNENLPDWLQFIDVDLLDLRWEESCVLGQYHLARYGEANFTKILHALFDDDANRAVELGFLDLNFDYRTLNAAWKLKLRELNSNGNEA